MKAAITSKPPRGPAHRTARTELRAPPTLKRCAANLLTRAESTFPVRANRDRGLRLRAGGMQNLATSLAKTAALGRSDPCPALFELGGVDS